MLRNWIVGLSRAIRPLETYQFSFYHGNLVNTTLSNVLVTHKYTYMSTFTASGGTIYAKDASKRLDKFASRYKPVDTDPVYDEIKNRHYYSEDQHFTFNLVKISHTSHRVCQRLGRGIIVGRHYCMLISDGAVLPLHEIKYFVDLFFAHVNKQQILNNALFNEDAGADGAVGDFPQNSVVQSTHDSSDVSTNIKDETELSGDVDGAHIAAQTPSVRRREPEIDRLACSAEDNAKGDVIQDYNNKLLSTKATLESQSQFDTTNASTAAGVV